MRHSSYLHFLSPASSLQFLKRGVVAVAVALVYTLFVTAPVGAQQAAGNGLEIKPPLIELQAEPKQTIEVTIKLKNISMSFLKTRATVNDFVASGESGLPKLLLDESEKSPYSIKGWVQPIPEMAIKPGQESTITFKVEVPADAAPGGHYGVLRFTNLPPDDIQGNKVAVTTSIGTLLLINISGKTKTEATFAEFSSAKDGKKRKLFETGPISFTERIQNTGSSHFNPLGVVEIKDLSGKKIAQLPINETGGNILPQSIRKFEQTLPKRFMLGPYRARAIVQYGNQTQVTTSSFIFWVIPYKLILLFLCIMAALVITGRWLYQNKRNLKHYIRSLSDRVPKRRRK